MLNTQTLLGRAYSAFNHRDIGSALALMSENVSWPKASEGGRVVGKEEIRSYWTRQWKEFDPHVEPLEMIEREGGITEVKVHQVVKSLAGDVLSDREVWHVYTVANGFIERMDLKEGETSWEPSHMPSPTPQAIPPDDPTRSLTLARPNEDTTLRHVSIAGDTYTLLVTGDDTAGRYCLIDMFVPPAGGPPPHRHDFEEMFTVLEGVIEIMFRGTTSTARAGETINIPANAPHAFRNASAQPARLLCMCSPPGQERFFLEVGDLVASRTAPPPALSQSERATRMAKAEALAPRYRTELLKP